ncbi:MAG: hypothetical protein Q8918_07990 [Bacteroidota bacterium]|nr:hypothetical protein [Bacteroidota bacterium]MDP4211273.1 hypothetical protein [Bacteroidota bacterium]MDP4250038.1 hypothetical protein [Bacteroidota bacterium]
MLISFLIILPFSLVHFVNGVEPLYYVKSLTLLFTVFVFGFSVHLFLVSCHSLRSIYKSLLLANGVMVLVSLVALFVEPFKLIFWNDNGMSLGNINIHRLKMLTYEPSYYSMLFVPVAMYYLIKLFRREISQPYLIGALVIIPLLLSLSFGVILGIAFALLVLIVLNSRKTIFSVRNLQYAAAIFTVLVSVGVLLIYLFPENVFVLRIENVLAGKDTSFNGRTLDSFILGRKIADMKSIYWGSGLGQAKLLGLDLFREYYQAPHFTINDISIPNSMGDMLATFGLIGVLLKLFLELYFYFRTRVSDNYYRSALFLFIFLYQFTGSFLMNVAEYVIWILAFYQGLFPEFDKKGVMADNLSEVNSIH